jgi:hypothetical protein
MPEITEQDKQAAHDAWKELATGQFCFVDAFSRDVIAAVIADAIAHARQSAFEAGKREGIQRAVQSLLDTTRSHIGCTYDALLREAEALIALLPAPTATTDEGETP